MKVAVIGLSPYLLTSRAKINSWILQYLFLSGDQVIGLVWGHDTSYYIPDEATGQFSYHFDYAGAKHEIPIIPFTLGENDSVAVYETLNRLQPDIILTVGDLPDFLFLRAVKSFCQHPFKWVWILTNYGYPLNENHIDLLREVQAIICVNRQTYEMVKVFYAGILDMHYVGCNRSIYNYEGVTRGDKFRVMTCLKNEQKDNLPAVMEAGSQIRIDIPCLELYIHANVHDHGDFDLQLLKERFDPQGEFIVFPEKYVSILEGYAEQEYAAELKKSDVFISTPMTTASGMSVFQAVSCGCFPILSDEGINAELAEVFDDYCWHLSLQKKDFLVPTMKFIGGDEKYLGICDMSYLKKRIVFNFILNKHAREISKRLSESLAGNTHGKFLEKIKEVLNSVGRLNDTLSLETVRR